VKFTNLLFTFLMRIC